MSDKSNDSQDAGAEEKAPTDEVFSVDFNTFVLSLSTSALMHLGVELMEGQPANTVNLPLAKQSIELIEMLEKKTQGNLSGEEERLMAQVLFDLRKRYVAASKG